MLSVTPFCLQLFVSLFSLLRPPDLVAGHPVCTSGSRETVDTPGLTVPFGKFPGSGRGSSGLLLWLPGNRRHPGAEPRLSSFSNIQKISWVRN